jgi:hypothetical protein
MLWALRFRATLTAIAIDAALATPPAPAAPRDGYTETNHHAPAAPHALDVTAERLAWAIGTATDCGHSSCASGRDTSRHLADAADILAALALPVAPEKEGTK